MVAKSNLLALYRLAALCRKHGYLDLWHLVTRSALAMPHHAFEHLYHRGNAKLLLDDWSGWVDREVRVHDPAAGYLASEYVRQIRYKTIEWDGQEIIADKTILILADGDCGDCIQMLRFIPPLVERCRGVILSVRPEMASLVKHNVGHLASITFHGIDCGPFERYAWLMSLPALFGCLPVFTPMTALRPRTRATNARYPVDIGVCWSEGGDRSIALDELAPLFGRRDWRWHSLQLAGAGEGDGDSFRGCPAIRLRTLADAANYVMGLDCVVSVDAAVAHLAGALGLPTLTLLRSSADARWGLNDTTPWYPSMRLIRQRAAGDWRSAIQALGAGIEAIAVDLAA